MAKKRGQQERSKDLEYPAILARQSLRYRVLRLIHELSDGAVERHVTPFQLQQCENVSAETLEEVLSYLRDEKLINAPAYGFYQVSLRHKGLVEIEKAICDPNAGTEHFDAKVTSKFTKAPGGSSRTLRIAGPDIS